MNTLHADLTKALEDIDVRHYTLLEWSNHTHTNVSAYKTRNGWEVFCWSSQHLPGVDFDDIIKFPLEDMLKHDDTADTPEIVEITMQRSKKYAMVLYDVTVGRLTNMGAKTVHVV